MALDKCPGIKPVNIGNVAGRQCAKVMIDMTGNDVQAECSSDQLCLEKNLELRDQFIPFVHCLIYFPVMGGPYD